MLFVLIIELILIYFSYKQPAELLKKPTSKNQIISSVLGALSFIFLLFGLIVVFDGIGSVIFRIILLLVGALYGWFTYRNFITLIYVKQNTESIQNSGKYCSQCGREFTEAEKLCASCGSERLKQSFSPALVPSISSLKFKLPELKFDNRDLKFWIRFISPAMVILMMFHKWVKIPALNFVGALLSSFTGSSKKSLGGFTLFGISKAVGEISKFAGSSGISKFIGSNGMELAAVILKIAAIAVVIVQVVYIYALLTNMKNIKSISLISACITSLVSICFLIAISRINSSITKMSYDLLDNSVKSTLMPYLAIIFSLVDVAVTHIILKNNSYEKQLSLDGSK